MLFPTVIWGPCLLTSANVKPLSWKRIDLINCGTCCLAFLVWKAIYDCDCDAERLLIHLPLWHLETILPFPTCQHTLLVITVQSCSSVMRAVFMVSLSKLAQVELEQNENTALKLKLVFVGVDSTMIYEL